MRTTLTVVVLVLLGTIPAAGCRTQLPETTEGPDIVPPPSSTVTKLKKSATPSGIEVDSSSLPYPPAGNAGATPELPIYPYPRFRPTAAADHFGRPGRATLEPKATFPTPRPSKTPTAISFPPTLTAIPLENWPISTTVIDSIDFCLSPESIWVKHEQHILALDQDSCNFELETFVRSDGLEIKPSSVVAAPDGSSMAYVAGDRLIIDHIDKKERWIYEYQSLERGQLHLSVPQFSPDGNRIVYAMMHSDARTWGLKQLDLLSGNETIIPIPDRYCDSGSSSNIDSSSTVRSFGGPCRLAFIPRNWTALGIVGHWTLPFAGGISRNGWLIDADTGHPLQEIEGGGGSLATPTGKYVVFIEGKKAFEYSEDKISALILVDLETMERNKILTDDIRYLNPMAWSPNERALAYLAHKDWGEQAGTVGIIRRSNKTYRELDLSATMPQAQILSMKWSDNENLILLIRDPESSSASIVQANVQELIASELKELGTINLEDEYSYAYLVYVPFK